MRICAVMKYPPIQGGVSATSYWLAHGLAELGHEVHVVTNAFEVEDEYRLVLAEEDRAWLAPSAASGRVVLHTSELTRRMKHIPQSNPFVSKLAGTAADIVRRHECEILFGYYLEPYGVAAHLAAAWTGRPYVIANAGSDLGRLMGVDGLSTTHREVIRRADGIAGCDPRLFLGFGASVGALYANPQAFLPRPLFGTDTPPMDIGRVVASLAELHPDRVLNPGAFNPSIPTLGIYGKTGVPKGTYDLLAALGELKRSGLRFNLVALTDGSGGLRRAIHDHDLDQVVWMMPFLPHWRIPSFIRACHAVCYLERDFPITLHAPRIAREVLSCGGCLIVSGEIAAKQAFLRDARPGEDFLLVQDPRDHAELTRALRHVIEDPAGALAIGRRGAALVADGGDHLDTARGYAAVFDDIVARRRGEPCRLTAAERRLPADREGWLRALLPTFFEALGTALAEPLRAHMDCPAATDPFADAMSLCDLLASRAALTSDAQLTDAARYGKLLLWMARIVDDEDVSPPFGAPDLLIKLPDGTRLASMTRLAPLRTAWLRTARFRFLPPGLIEKQDPGGDALVVFHKTPNLNGHQFRINDRTAELLERCDGRASIAEIIAGFAARTGQPEAAVREACLAAVSRLHRAGIIVLIEPLGTS